MKQVPLSPAGRGPGSLFVFTAAKDFDVWIIVEAIAVRDPAGWPALISISDQWQEKNLCRRNGGSERFGRGHFDRLIGADLERFLEDAVLA